MTSTRRSQSKLNTTAIISAPAKRSTPTKVSTPATDIKIGSAISIPGIELEKLSEEGRLIISIVTESFKQLLAIQTREIIERKDCEIKDMKVKILDLEEKLTNVEEQLDSKNQKERGDSLIISGEIPSARPNENCTKIVRELIRNGLSLNITEQDISNAYRIGKKPSDPNQPDKRNICLKVCRRELKRDITFACKQTKPNFYINEQLTPTRTTIMYVLRKAKREFPNQILNARSTDGNITLFLAADTPNSSPRRINVNTRATLEDILQKIINKTSADFTTSWPQH